MRYDFDKVSERRKSDSAKWGKYGEGILPMWVADMDFISAEPILCALQKRVSHGFFGYPRPLQELCLTLQERLLKLYQWEVQEEHLCFLPGLVAGLNAFLLTFTQPGEAVLAQPPVYHHFLQDPRIHGRIVVDPPLTPRGDSYEIDFKAFEESITERAKVFILCNPHNPVGRVFTRQELENLAEICLRRRLIICSDEIHCDLCYRGYRHTPIASLAPEVAAQTVTLMAPSKTYNLAGLRFGFAVITNPELRERWKKTCHGIVPGVNTMGQVAALAGYRHGQEWLAQVMEYLEDSRDLLYRYVAKGLPGLRMIRMEATYLAWLDCREAQIPGSPFEFFLHQAKVAFSDGVEFGRGGEGFVRMNFACPRKTLAEALERMSAALNKL